MDKEWSNVLAEVEAAIARLRFEATEECLFRGQANHTWPVLPSLLRFGLDAGKLAQVESDLFFEFRAHARELHGLNLSDWDVLFYMRHYGVPTRLLDWTDSLGVAIYFALEEYQDGGPEPCIWLLNPFTLNDDDFFSPKNLGWDEDEGEYYDYGELLLEEEPFDWDEPVAVYPNKNNPRLFAQRGYFTMHGMDLRPLDQLAHGKGYLEKVVLPRSAIPEARRFLQLAGLDRYRIYGDLESLARVLKEKYVEAAAQRVPNARQWREKRERRKPGGRK